MKPREDQEQAIAFALDALADHRRALLQLPTGTGKTLCGLLIAKRWLGSQRKVYILTPSVQALAQTIKLGQLLGIRVTADQGERTASRFCSVVGSTYATAWARHQRIPRKNTLLILDECHHINYQAPVNVSMLEHFEQAVGLSATPWSIGCHGYFGHNCHVFPLSRSIAMGINCEFEITKWQEPDRNGRYQVIYSRNISKMHPLIRSMAGTDYAIYKRRQAAVIIERFRRGMIRSLVVDRMLTEGFDLKQIKSIYVDRLVMSRILLMQMLGRALRPCDGKRASIAIRHPLSYRRLLQAVRRAQ